MALWGMVGVGSTSVIVNRQSGTKPKQVIKKITETSY